MGARARSRRLAAFCGYVLLAAASPAAAQNPAGRQVYYPLRPTTMPTGTAADWAAKIGKGACGYYQPIRVELPGGGTVTYFDGTGDRGVTLPAPAQAGLLIGPVYRMRIGDMPEFPGVLLYPSIEVLDRLHPPVGRANDFPVPIQFTEEEIRAALSGQLVTKVVYLEQPNRALPIAIEHGSTLPTQIIPARENPLYVADLAGRPMLIVRLGSRLPDAEHERPEFFGSGAPIQIDATVSGPKAAP